MTEQKSPIKMPLSFPAQSALKVLASKINGLRPSQDSKSQMTEADRALYIGIIRELLAAETKPLEFARAEEVICTLKLGQKLSVNGSSILRYATNVARGKSWNGESRYEPDIHANDFAALNEELLAYIKHYEFNYEGFKQVQKPIRTQANKRPTLAEKQVRDRRNDEAAKRFTTEEMDTKIVEALTNYKKQRNYQLADDDAGLGYYRTVREAVKTLESPATAAMLKKTLREHVKNAIDRKEMHGLIDRFGLEPTRLKWGKG